MNQLDQIRKELNDRLETVSRCHGLVVSLERIDFKTKKIHRNLQFIAYDSARNKRNVT